MILDGGAEVVSGGTDYGAVIAQGGQQIISVGTAFGATVDGGLQYIAGGTAIGTVINAGGFQVAAAGIASGTVINGVGFERIQAGGSGAGTQTIAGGNLYIESGATLTGAIRFAPGTTGGLLSLADPVHFSQTVSGFARGDTIDLGGLVFSGARPARSRATCSTWPRARSWTTSRWHRATMPARRSCWPTTARAGRWFRSRASAPAR